MLNQTPTKHFSLSPLPLVLACLCSTLLGCASRGPAYQNDPEVQQQIIADITAKLSFEHPQRPSIEHDIRRMRRTSPDPHDDVELAIQQFDYEKAVSLLDQMEAAGRLTYQRSRQRAFAADQAYHQFNAEVHESGTWLKKQFQEPMRFKAQRATAAYETA